MGVDQVLGFLGMLLGASGGLFGLWWGRKLAARKRGIDERYESIAVKALANGWKITLIYIYVLFILLLLGIQLSVAPVLGTLLLIHMAGWAFSLVYYQIKF
jgi:hypothetical protein